MRTIDYSIYLYLRSHCQSTSRTNDRMRIFITNKAPFTMGTETAILIITNSACPCIAHRHTNRISRAFRYKGGHLIERLFTSFNKALNICEAQLLCQHIIETAWCNIKICMCTVYGNFMLNQLIDCTPLSSIT